MKSINEQVRAAIVAGGGQAAVLKAIRAQEGSVSQPMLARISAWQTPSLATLRQIARAVPGWHFIVDEGTDIGSSRPPGPADRKRAAK